MDAKEYNDCVKQWADALFRFAWKCSRHKEDARDLVQNAFEILWTKKETVSPEKAKAFLFQIAYNQSVDLFRKKQRMPLSEPPILSDFSPPGHPDLKRILDKAFEQLDTQAKALVLLKDYEGYSYEEISGITGLSLTQVKVYLHRTRKQLKQYLISVEHII